jgi:hypothetical protein
MEVLKMGFWHEDFGRGIVKAIEIYPYGEFWKVLEAAERAIEKKDLEALIWCARRVFWFCDMGETEALELGDEATERYFNAAFNDREKLEPAPALIADLVAPDKETVSAADVGKALDMLRQFLDSREDMARNEYQAAARNIDSLRCKFAALAVGE